MFGEEKKVLDAYILQAIMIEVDLFIEDGAITNEELYDFDKFCNAFDIINAYEEGYKDGMYRDYLDIVYKKIIKDRAH